MSEHRPLKDRAKRVLSLTALGPRVSALEALAKDTGTAVARVEGRLAAIEAALRQVRQADDEVEIDFVGQRCSDFVGEHVPPGQRVAVLTDGDPAVFVPNDWPVEAFPHGSRPARTGGDFDHGAGPIAHLEVQRIEGIRFVLVPDASRGWLQRYPEFAEHLTDRYDVVADESGVGLLVDVGTRQVTQRRQQTLVDVLDHAVDGNRYAAILDWTDLELDSLILGRNMVTAPPGTDGKLHYLDRTIDVVVIHDLARLEEGRRVASDTVVVVSAGEGEGLRVTRIEDVRADSVSAVDPILVVIAVEPGDPWLTHVEEAIAGQHHLTLVAAHDPWGAAAAAESNVVVVAERGVLPLPGCIEASATLVMSEGRIGGVAAKLLAADGSLEAAGSMIFGDGSVESISGGRSEVAAAWHEYVRPVCATPGLLAARATALREAQVASGSLTAVSAALWQAGYELHYQPDAWAVRTLHSNGADAPAGVASAGWVQALSARPERPAALNARAWRSLLAQEDVRSAWE